jgi:hypothetical protein
MCVICLSLEKDLITINEANEIYQKIKHDISSYHVKEVGDMLWGKSIDKSGYEPDFKIADEITDIMWLFDPNYFESED